MLNKWLTSIAVCAALLLASTAASAAGATDVVRANQSKLFEVIAQPKSAARQVKLKELFDAFIDYDHMVRNSLGDKWDELDQGQRTRFATLLTELIRSNYRKNLTDLLKFEIQYQDESAKKDGTVVNTVAKHKTDKREPPIELDFLMLNKGGKWVIGDIIPEDASMVKTYRAQFLRILKKDGFEALLKKMQEKLDKLET
jgi:phospholipid transport system substrate-binding protein